MSSRDWFWFLAGVLVTVAVMAIARPWLRGRPVQTEQRTIPSFAVPIAAALALIGVALGIYFLIGSPDSIASAATQVADTSGSQQMSSSTTSAGSLDDVTRKLATRLAAKGGTDSEWKLLAESYDYMGRAADAKAARAHIASAAASDAATAGSTGTSADGPGGEPLDGQTMVAVADALTRPTDASRTNANPRANATGANSTGAHSAAGADAGAAEVSGSVEIASKLASRATPGATLFVYAKQPNAPGPPLAVLRLQVEHWPVTFKLSDANAMVPGRNLSSAQSVQIEARISRSGDALPQSGDLVGTVTGVNPRGGRPVKISIDREIG
jgi:cytochrome c-type biogenesis protein CcmH